MGKISLVSRLPQYLMIDCHDLHDTHGRDLDSLDDGDVDGCRGGGLIYGRHCGWGSRDGPLGLVFIQRAPLRISTISGA